MVKNARGKKYKYSEVIDFLDDMNYFARHKEWCEKPRRGSITLGKKNRCQMQKKKAKLAEQKLFSALRAFKLLEGNWMSKKQRTAQLKQQRRAKRAEKVARGYRTP